MKNKAFSRFCIVTLMTSFLVLLLLGTSSLLTEKFGKGTFYTNSESSASMSCSATGETSLGAIALPGHSIVGDNRAEAIIRNHQYGLKNVIILLIMSVVLLVLSIRTCEKKHSDLQKFCRLLI